jgi:hypothetical protein
MADRHADSDSLCPTRSPFTVVPPDGSFAGNRSPRARDVGHSDSAGHSPLSHVIRLEASRQSQQLFGRYLRPEEILVREKNSGSFSCIYMLRWDQSRVILKLREVVDPRGWCSTDNEIQGLHLATGRVNAPRLRFASNSKGDFPFEYVAIDHISGRMPMPGRATVRSIAGSIGRLHATPRAPGARLPDGTNRGVAAAIDDCMELYSQLSRNPQLPTGLRKKLDRSIRTVISPRPAADSRCSGLLVPSHGDPVPRNFIIQFYSSELYLVDWETFALAPWTFDVWACLSPAFHAWGWKRSLDGHEKLLFLQTYCNSTGLTPCVAADELNAVNPVYSLRYALWCLKRCLDLHPSFAAKRQLADTFLRAAQLALHATKTSLIDV